MSSSKGKVIYVLFVVSIVRLAVRLVHSQFRVREEGK
jgi:cell division protein FtsL